MLNLFISYIAVALTLRKLRNAYEPKEDIEKDREGRSQERDEKTCGDLVNDIMNTSLSSLFLCESLVDLYLLHFCAGVVELLF